MREKYETRRFLLRGETQVDSVVACVLNVPIDPINPLEVVIRELVKKRGADQNALYWRRVEDIAEQAVVDGKRFSKHVWHDYLCKNIMPPEIETGGGEVRSKWEEGPIGSLSVISTTRLSKRCFAEYTTMVEVFGCELKVKFQERGYEI